MRVLLVDDDKYMCHGITQQLLNRNIACDVVHAGDECIKQLLIHDYDVVILDLMLPDVSGYDLLKKLRMNNIKVPVLILSSISEIDKKIQGFDYGADDYLVKPFHQDELFARVDALIRRSKGHADTNIKIGELLINIKDKTAEVMGKKLNLTKKEYAILELLALHKGSTLHKDVFFSHLYYGIETPEIKIIDVFVCKIRRKIQAIMGYDPGYITTVWGRGYSIDECSAENQTANILAAV